MDLRGAKLLILRGESKKKKLVDGHPSTIQNANLATGAYVYTQDTSQGQVQSFYVNFRFQINKDFRFIMCKF